jgi:hypothetical protein
MKFDQIKKGEVLSTTLYTTVQKKTADGRSFAIKGPQFIEGSMNSSEQFTTTKKVSRTEVVEAFVNAGDSVFTVNFIKADGQERVLVGRLLNTENHMGRSNVEDLQTTDKNKMRQVDHRTINWTIVRGIKWMTK